MKAEEIKERVACVKTAMKNVHEVVMLSLPSGVPRRRVVATLRLARKQAIAALWGKRPCG